MISSFAGLCLPLRERYARVSIYYRSLETIGIKEQLGYDQGSFFSEYQCI